MTHKLMKIKDVSTEYNITARTLRYYEDSGLVDSIRNDDVAYRMYDEKAIRRIEQILILRKLNISIKDIKHIFDSQNSDSILEILGKKIENIDDEIALLDELRDIVADFIQEIERIGFERNSDIQHLYRKAKEIETQIATADYSGKPSKVKRLIEITDQLDKKVPDVMVIRVPAFKGLSTGTHYWMEVFKDGGYMFQLWQNFKYFKPILFDCLDFTLVKGNEEMEMICSLKDDVTIEDVGPLAIVDFPGGLYAMAVSIDDDDESIQKVQDKMMKWLESTNFEIDESRNFMFNMPYLDEEDEYQKDIERGLGYRQQQRYLPIKLRESL